MDDTEYDTWFNTICDATAVESSMTDCDTRSNSICYENGAAFTGTAASPLQTEVASSVTACDTCLGSDDAESCGPVTSNPGDRKDCVADCDSLEEKVSMSKFFAERY
jgi:hypothetical protein